MYIGPWQEYNLSKTNRARPHAVTNTKIKNDLEESLAKTLDPIAAQAAIAAVETFFNSQQQSANGTLQPLVIPSSSVPKRPTQRLPPRHARGGRRHLPSLHNRVVQSAQDTLQSSDSTHTIFTDSSTPVHTPDSRRQGNDATTPLSVRSTQSEPIPTRLPLINNAQMNVKPMFSPHKNNLGSPMLNNPNLNPNTMQLPSLHDAHNSSSVTSGYNANAVVNMLKLQKRQAISRVTGWAAGSSSVDAVLEAVDSDGLKAKRKLDPIERDKEKKLEHINTMRQAYLQPAESMPSSQVVSGPLVQTNSKELSSVSASYGGKERDKADFLAAIKEESSLLDIPTTPQIQAINITDNELKLVSKYFTSNDAAPSNTVRQPKHQAPTVNAQLAGVAFSSPVGSPLRYAPSQSTPLATPNSSRTHQTYDELHVGGIDGLLKWSSQLDMDNL